jgi:PAS domain-containing protein
MDPSALSDYEQHFGRFDPYWPAFLKAPQSQVVLGEQLCSRGQLLKTEFYHEFLAHHDEPLAIYCVAGRGIHSARWQAISCYERLRDESPPIQSAQRFRIMMPHVCSTLATQERLGVLAAESMNLASALNALGSAVILLDEKGHVLFVSQRAEGLIGRGRSIDISSGRLRVPIRRKPLP